MFINSGTADCESLQSIYGPKVEANQTDSAYLKKAIAVMKMMKCTESEAYFQASYYMYKINLLLTLLQDVDIWHIRKVTLIQLSNTLMRH